MIKMSLEVNKIFLAMAKAQAAMEPVRRLGKAVIPTKSGPGYSYTYADLTDVQETIKKPFADNELFYSQMPSTEDGKCFLTTLIGHSSGQWIMSDFEMKLTDSYFNKDTGQQVHDDLKPQDIGSLVTYWRRYALAPAAGVSQVDDDGKGANEKASRVPTTAAKPANPFPKPPPETPPNSAPSRTGISAAQVSRMYTIGFKKKNLNQQDIDVMMQTYGVKNWQELTKLAYDEVCKALEAGMLPAQIMAIKRGEPLPLPEDTIPF